MIIIGIIVLIACLVSVAFCPYRILKNPRTSPLYQWTTAVTGLIVIGISYIYTFYYIYYPDTNTRVHGWPIPVVIFQRSAPGERWLDFVGWTTVFGFPLNLILFVGTWLFILWILNIVIIKMKKNNRQPEQSE